MQVPHTQYTLGSAYSSTVINTCIFCLACFVLISYIGGQERLYCTHEALNVAFDNPSAFCQVSGIEHN